MAQRTLTREERRARNDYREAERIERMFERMRTADERHARQEEYHNERSRERHWREKNADLSRRKLTPPYCRCFVKPDKRKLPRGPTTLERSHVLLAELMGGEPADGAMTTTRS